MISDNYINRLENNFYDGDISNEKFNDLNVFDECFQVLNASKTIFQNACFKNVKFVSDVDILRDESVVVTKRCNFKWAEFYNCTFIDCDFSYCDFSLSKFMRSKFEQCIIKESSFIGTDLNSLIAKDCDFSRSDFRKANLIGANFFDSIMKGSFFNDALFNETKISLWGNKLIINNME